MSSSLVRKGCAGLSCGNSPVAAHNGGSFRAGGVEAPVQKRHHPMPERCSEQIVPVYVFLEQGEDPLAVERPCTSEHSKAAQLQGEYASLGASDVVTGASVELEC